MLHQCKNRTLSRRSGPRKALLRSLAKSLCIHERINTTLVKAKTIRRVVEKLITKGRCDSIHSRRLIIAKLGGGKSAIAVAEKILILSKKYIDRPGGYLRILKCGFRKGDAAPMAVISFVDSHSIISANVVSDDSSSVAS